MDTGQSRTIKPRALKTKTLTLPRAVSLKLSFFQVQMSTEIKHRMKETKLCASHRLSVRENSNTMCKYSVITSDFKFNKTM